ncbi:MAG: HPr family phosphocarrier protein [Lachnospiraceae bacterium]|nr:HPr family phosphocarrier protein [Lachnospiraceae bacterium]
MVRRKIIIAHKAGFHVRPAGIVAKAAESCSSRVEILYKNSIINAKSLLNILSASIRQGAEIELCCEGPEEQADLDKMTYVIEHLS